MSSRDRDIVDSENVDSDIVDRENVDSENVDSDIVIVGSGMNSLVCAALLARSGQKVVVLERNDRLGGCIRTEELFPGYTHDVLSGWYPLFLGGPAYAELADDLAARGLEFVNTETPTGIVTPDGRSLVLSTDLPANGARIDELSPGDGGRFLGVLDEFFTRDAEFTFGLLGSQLRSRSTAWTVLKELRSRKVAGSAAFSRDALETCRSWLERDFSSDLLQGLVAPWVLHAGLGPDDANSGLMGKVIIAAVATGGLPVAVGGSSKVVDAFVKLIEDHGGALITDAEVAEITVRDGRGNGVVTADGRRFGASKAVVCNVTPQQLYGSLLPSASVPDTVAAEAAAYRYGRADMQIHYALSSPPAWDGDPTLADTAMVHLTAGLDGVSRSVNEAMCGLLPTEGTVVVGQPCAVDPSRAPDGGSILWIQLQELPRHVKGDAAGEIDVGDGSWTPALAERYADRIHQRLVRHIPGLDTSVVGRRIVSPADLASMNVNLVGGDPYSGSCTLDQNLLWRPLAGTKNHATPVKGVYHIGASTHPGPGLGGTSGFLVAKALS